METGSGPHDPHNRYGIAHSDVSDSGALRHKNGDVTDVLVLKIGDRCYHVVAVDVEMTAGPAHPTVSRQQSHRTRNARERSAG